MIQRFLPLLFCASLTAQVPKLNPVIKRVVGEISEKRIAASLRKLETFGTRHVSSDQDDLNRGIGAAQRWLHQQFSSCNPRLEVYYDAFQASKSARVDREVELANVVAVLPGTTQKERIVMVSAHYDTIVLKGGAAGDHSQAPGVNDNGSGIAAVLELARVLSQHEFEKTLVFVAFAGEEVGLLGSRHFAKKAKDANQEIEAVLNNDIIGNDRSGNGVHLPDRVRIFSEGPEDSDPRTLARYFKDIGERYVPAMKVDLIYRADRVDRGGDHTPFAQAGFPAIRVTTAAENYENQHSLTDTFENVSVPYNTRVAKLNAAVMASLALAPQAPDATRSGSDDRRVPRMTRSGYDADLQWYQPGNASDLAGYSIVMRPTSAALWDKELFVGEVTAYTLKNVSIDDLILGVRAWDKDGNPSVVAPFVCSSR